MRDKIERKAFRLHDYDYSTNGLYFITICTHEKRNYFGSIVNGEMHLSDYGKIAKDEIETVNIKRKDQYIKISK